MQVTVRDVTGLALVHAAMARCGATTRHAPLALYRARHSVIYARLFWVNIEGVTERVHTHLIRSRVGVSWWVESQRPDRGGAPGLRSLSALINAEALIVLAQKRLCQRAWPETRDAVLAVREQVARLDTDLVAVMHPRCVWERGCRELRPCGWYERQVLDDDGWPVGATL